MNSSYKIGRSAITGRYTTVATAVRKSSTHIVETVKHEDDKDKTKK